MKEDAVVGGDWLNTFLYLNSISSNNGKMFDYADHVNDYYNRLGLKQGWLRPENAVKLKKLDELARLKNIYAVRDVINFWIKVFRGEIRIHEIDPKLLNIPQIMAETVKDFLEHRRNKYLEYAAFMQHQQWRKFEYQYQRERITEGNPEFREDNYHEFSDIYDSLPDSEKEKDRMVVAIVTNLALAKSGISYKSMI